MTLDLTQPPLSLLRQQLRQMRRALSEQQQAEHARLLAENLLSFVSVSSSLAIGVTAAFDGEIDPFPATQALRAAGHVTYLPILRSDKHLDFALWHQDSMMITNQFGILEPQTSSLTTVGELDVLLVPLVGVDAKGNRLGMGGGYYDRTLGQAGKRPYLIGVAHQCQLVERLAAQPWDVSLDALITEQEVKVWRKMIESKGSNDVAV